MVTETETIRIKQNQKPKRFGHLVKQWGEWSMVTLKDVARECGMSVTQVSRALNDYDDVSLKTREMVKKTAREMGYVKNLTAKSLSAKQQRQIAVLVIGLGYIDEYSPFVIDTIMGVNRFASENGYEMVVHFIDSAPDSYEAFCKQRGIGGVIILRIDYLQASYNQLLLSDFPAVCVDAPLVGINKGCIVVDDEGEAKKAVLRLAAAGCKKIALVSGEAGSYTTICRRQGYEAALAEAGLGFDPELVVTSDYRCAKAREDVSALVGRRPDIDGIFCMSDYMALGALNALHDLRIDVPGRISLIGYDGLNLTEYAQPAIASVKQDHSAKGYAGARMICDMLNGEQKENRVTIPCELIERASIKPRVD